MKKAELRFQTSFSSVRLGLPYPGSPLRQRPQQTGEHGAIGRRGPGGVGMGKGSPGLRGEGACVDQATSSWCNPTPGGTAQPHSYSPFPCVSPSNAHQHPSFPRLIRISTASACTLSPFKGFTFKQNEKTNKNPKHFAVNDGEGLKDGGGLKHTPSCF